MYPDQVVERLEDLARAELCYYAEYSGAERVIRTCHPLVYSSRPLAVFRTYEFHPIRLPSTPAVAKKWGSTELRWLDAIDVLVLASVAPRFSYDMGPKFLPQ